MNDVSGTVEDATSAYDGVRMIRGLSPARGSEAPAGGQFGASDDLNAAIQLNSDLPPAHLMRAQVRQRLAIATECAKTKSER